MAASTESTILHSHVGIKVSWAFAVNRSGILVLKQDIYGSDLRLDSNVIRPALPIVTKLNVPKRPKTFTYIVLVTAERVCCKVRSCHRGTVAVFPPAGVAKLGRVVDQVTPVRGYGRQGGVLHRKADRALVERLLAGKADEGTNYCAL